METPITLKQILLEEAERNFAIAEKLFQKVDDGKLNWKPPLGSSWMTVGQLLMHCSRYGAGIAIKGFVKGEWDLMDQTQDLGRDPDTHQPPAEALSYVESVEEALDLLGKDRKITLECISEAAEEDMLSKKITAPWGGDEMTLFQHLTMMIGHLCQHKGQLFYYLKLMGKKVDTSDLWGV